MESRLAQVITYEDPAYRDPSDIADVASQVRRDGDVRPVLVPREGRLDVTIDVRPGDPASLENAIEEILLASARSGNPGAFRVEQAGDVFHVIPAPTGGGDAVALLDTPIQPDGAERSVLEWIEQIAHLVGRARGTDVSVGTVPVNLFQQHRVRASSRNEVVRNVLRQLLGDLKEKISWTLLYDPAGRQYVLNLHIVPARQS